MAEGNQSVTIVAVLAILILVGLAVYFVTQESDDDIEIDLGAVPELVQERAA